MPGIYRTATLAGTDLPVYLPPSATLGAGTVWDARSAAPVGVGGRVTSLAPTNGGDQTMTTGQAQTTTGPTLKQDATGYYLSFDGVTDALGVNMSIPGAYTIATVFRARTILAGGITGITGMASGAVSVVGIAAGPGRINAGASLNTPGNVTAGTLYAVVACFNGASSGVRFETAGMGAGTTAAQGNAGTNPRGNISLARWLTTFSAIDIYQCTYWPATISGAQFATVCAEQRAQFGM